ncbi:MAG: hypothetical protein HYV77_02675, partial [Candidatus Wildermuthbacteria bacterium]|nr:hypothetical protein [Candidatus Wildermuthbacteria bacterium]
MAGDFLFTNAIDAHYYRKGFLEFGTELTGPSGTDIMPHPTYILPLKTKLFSPVKGKVETIRSQSESSDYEIVIVPDGFSSWRVSFDHVVNLQVKKGDTVEAGDTVAEVAPSMSVAVPPTMGLVELQVWKESSSFWSRGAGEAKCPFVLLDKSVQQDIAVQVTQLATDWE